MFKNLKSYFCARTSGTVHCKNLAFVESVKLLNISNENLSVQVITKKNDKLKLYDLKPTFIRWIDEDHISIQIESKPGCVDTIIANFAYDLMGNRVFAISFISSDRVVFTTFNHTGYATYCTLGKTACAMKLD